MADMADMLNSQRPDLIADLCVLGVGDLMYIPSLAIRPEYRGQQLGHSILSTILENYRTLRRVGSPASHSDAGR
ncbi:hypothetical protein ACQCSX_01870 [Pseudarthrobacter sp. P1]|uniref:hypothetical protein n=1 Tax=Pseudarthrobacter sp. P1 TaxID=3418418 RepID=UPI003CF3B457